MDVRVVNLECGVKFPNPCAGLFSRRVASAVGWVLRMKPKGFQKKQSWRSSGTILTFS
jgi:hypothetical protein